MCQCQHRCRYEDIHATSNTEEVIIKGEGLWFDDSTACRYEDFYASSNSLKIIIKGEGLWVDDSSDVAMRTSMLLLILKKSSL